MPIASPISSRARTAIDRLLIAILGIVAMLYAWSSFAGIANFAWRQPMFDQYRMYESYLTLPFPLNVMQNQNGHRPILPSLLHVAEIYGAGANQHWLIGVGMILIALTWFAATLCVLRERSWSPLQRATGALLVTLSVLWLANARMLLHGNEMVDTYFVAFCVVTGSALVLRARDTGGITPLLIAGAGCTAATFSFGTGVASFFALTILAAVLRVPLRRLWPLPLFLLLCLVVYVWLLPGDSAVRSVLHFEPLASVWVSLQWLGSPWVTAWLGLADPAVSPGAASLVAQRADGYWLAASAEIIVDVVGSEGRYVLAGLASLAGVVSMLIALWRQWRGGVPCTRTKAIALGLCLFGAGSALIIGIARLDYFRLYPDQRFADRYLVWPCLFWLGLALLALPGAARRRGGVYVAAAAALSLAAIALPMHTVTLGWGAAVYRNVQRFAAAVQSEVMDEPYYPTSGGNTQATSDRVLRLFRERSLAMYSTPLAHELGNVWTSSGQAADISVNFDAANEVDPANGGQHDAQFSGWIHRGIGKVLGDDGPLVVLDEDDRVSGYAQISGFGPGRGLLRLDVPRKRGFDGYVRHYRDGVTYRFAQLDATTHQARILGTLPAIAPMPPK